MIFLAEKWKSYIHFFKSCRGRGELGQVGFFRRSGCMYLKAQATWKNPAGPMQLIKFSFKIYSTIVYKADHYLRNCPKSVKWGSWKWHIPEPFSRRVTPGLGIHKPHSVSETLNDVKGMKGMCTPNPLVYKLLCCAFKGTGLHSARWFLKSIFDGLSVIGACMSSLCKIHR